MKKRDFLKNSLILAGGTIISGGVIATTMSSCKPDPASDSVIEAFTPKYFNTDQLSVMQQMIDCIIPSTDTAQGAIAIGCDKGIDQLIANTFKIEDKGRFSSALSNFNKGFKNLHKMSFADAKREVQLAELQKLEKMSYEAEAKESLIQTIKWLTYNSYFSSEYGQTEVLAFDPLPGNYDGCIDYSSVNNTWAE